MEKVIKVTNSPYQKTYVPGIKIAGKQLEKFGFVTNDLVLVKYEKNKIIIEKVTGRELMQRMILKNSNLEKLIDCFDLELINAEPIKHS